MKYVIIKLSSIQILLLKTNFKIIIIYYLKTLNIYNLKH